MISLKYLRLFSPLQHHFLIHKIYVYYNLFTQNNVYFSNKYTEDINIINKLLVENLGISSSK